MPTLVNVPEDEISDASETLLYEDDSPPILNEEEKKFVANSHIPIPQGTGHGGIDNEQHDEGEETMLYDQSATILSETILPEDEESETILFEEEHEEHGSLETHPKRLGVSSIGISRLERALDQVDTNVPGPNEILYRSKYESRVKSIIRQYDRQYPGHLRDYRTLSLDQQEKEQQRVQALLARLGIGQREQSQSHYHDDGTHNVGYTQQYPTQPQTPMKRYSLDDTLSPLMSPDCHGPPQWDNENSFHQVGDSFDDLTLGQSYGNDMIGKASSSTNYSKPSTQHPQQRSSRETPCAYSHHSSESVEIARGNAERSISPHSPPIYASPDPNRAKPSKRRADTSGKRGADLVRTKYNHEATSDDEHLEDPHEVISRRMEHLSLSPASSASPKDLFVATQSPISPRLTYGSSDEEDLCDDNFGGGLGNLIVDNDSHYSESNSPKTEYTIDTYTSHDKRRLLREVPMNCRLKEGAAFHLNKLDVKRSHNIRVATAYGEQVHRQFTKFADPLRRHGSKQRRALTDVYELLRKSEVGSRGRLETCAANVLFSLSYNQIVDLSLKLLLNDDTVRRRNGVANRAPLQGQTVVLVRTREDTEKWERALRDGTGCSVLNHSTLPLSERIRRSTAEKVTKFDVVLSTYDALKSADFAIPIDDRGRALLPAEGTENSWLQSRTSTQADAIQPQICRQLSVLQKVNFQRAIFVDILGRKSFLAKEDTARADAAVALRANSRYVTVIPKLC